MNRQPVVAGQFYEEDKEKLKKQLETCFSSSFGPGKLEKKTNKEIKAVIVPHAGYFFSGACAAHAYKKIFESGFSGTIILIGPNHFGYGTGLSVLDWETPLGIMKTDKELAEKIKQNTNLKIAEHCHREEHSLEVQIPFLQYIENKIKIVAIVLGSETDYKKLAKDLKKVLKNKKIIYVVSSDFTHYGLNYNYVPFMTDIKENLKKLDMGAIDKIINLDAKGFGEYIFDKKITICGYMGILLLLEILGKNPTKTTLLKYYTSSDVMGDFRNSVSYASILFK